MRWRWGGTCPRRVLHCCPLCSINRRLWNWIRDYFTYEYLNFMCHMPQTAKSDKRYIQEIVGRRKTNRTTLAPDPWITASSATYCTYKRRIHVYTSVLLVLLQHRSNRRSTRHQILVDGKSSTRQVRSTYDTAALGYPQQECRCLLSKDRPARIAARGLEAVLKAGSAASRGLLFSAFVVLISRIGDATLHSNLPTRISRTTRTVW